MRSTPTITQNTGNSTASYPSREARFRVLVADDHAVVRAGYRRFLEKHPAVLEIGEAVSGSDALERLRGGRWHVLLLDICMPDRGGLDILKRVRTKHPELRVLIISGLPETQYAAGVLQAGAFGYLSKELSATDFHNALDLVFEGRKYVSAAFADHLAGNLSQPRAVLPHEKLPAQGFQILLKLAQGHELQSIAIELKMSRKTVSAYRTRVMRELGCETHADLHRYALQQNLVQQLAPIQSHREKIDGNLHGCVGSLAGSGEPASISMSIPPHCSESLG